MSNSHLNSHPGCSTNRKTRGQESTAHGSRNESQRGESLDPFGDFKEEKVKLKLLLVLLMSATTLLADERPTKEQVDKIDVTSNPKVVEPCRRLGAIDVTDQVKEFRKEFGERLTDPVVFLKAKVVKVDGDTLLLGPHMTWGEGYRCQK